MNVKLSITIAGVAVLGPGFAFAQGAFELDEAIVYSGLIPVDVNRTGSIVDVLSDEDFEDGPLSVEEVLDTVPGVTYSANGGLGAASTLRLRGLDSTYIGVTIDGIEVTDPSSVQTSLNFGTLARGAVSRIEIAKGAQTAIYGSDAIAGAINITTWRPSKAGLSYGGALEAGSFGSVSSVFNVGLLDDANELAFSISGTRSDGFSAQEGDEESDGFNQIAANIYFARDISEAITLGFSALYSDSASEFDGFAGPDGEFFEDRRGVRAFAQLESDNISHELAASYFDITRFDPLSAFTNEFVGERVKLEYLGTTSLGSVATLAFGADWSKERSSLDGVSDDASNGAVFGEIQYAASDRTDVSVALRHDFYSDFDDQTTGRAALAFRLSDETTLKASVGTGYRAPSLYERFGPFGSATLEPETSFGGDIGFGSEFAGADVSATAFYTEIDDLIDFDFVTSTYSQVPGTTVSKGVELAASTSLGRTEVYGNYTYTDAKTEDTRQLRVPRHDLTIGVSAPLAAKLRGAIELRHVRDRLDVDTVTFATIPVDDYTVANASLTYSVSEEAEVYVRVENVFDEDYQTASGFNTAERSFYVGLRAAF